jgi:hypothetical protein
VATGVNGNRYGSTVPGFLDARVQVVTQAVVHTEARANFPGVLKIEIVRFAAHRGLVKLVTPGHQCFKRADGVEIRRRGEQSSQGIRQGIAGMNVVCAARRRNEHLRIGCASSEGVLAVGIGSENGGVAIGANIDAEFERVRAEGINHVVLELVNIAVRAKDRTIRGIEAFKQAITEGHRGLRVIGSGEDRCAADVSERTSEAEPRRNAARIFHGGAALVIEESDAEIGIDRGLVWIGGRAVNLIQAESGEERGFIGDSVVDANRELVRLCEDFGRGSVRARAVWAARFIGQGIAVQNRRDGRIDRNR